MLVGAERFSQMRILTLPVPAGSEHTPLIGCITQAIWKVYVLELATCHCRDESIACPVTATILVYYFISYRGSVVQLY